MTPDFSALQGYLDPAPGGLDARHAWAVNGGNGEGIRIIDIEGDWQLSHESLHSQQIPLLYGLVDPTWRDHGTAVLGEIAGYGKGSGVRGMAHGSTVGVVSIFDPSTKIASTARAIETAAANLAPGDILLIELHRPGPRYGGAVFANQQGYIPIEWWPDDYQAIRDAVDQGVIVVAAAGNGGEDLDASLFDAGDPGFPAMGWSNPFRRNSRDSGAILVGAGASPTMGAPDRSRLRFSNYGLCVDAQGWGEAVVTSGYGDLQNDALEDRRYTSGFSGTSSAAPMIVGALACIQGARRAAGQALLTPMQARNLLRNTGTPQQDAPERPATQRIGSRPDLSQLIP